MPKRRRLLNESPEDMWERFASGDDSASDDLLRHYEPQVRYVAERLAKGLPSHVDIEDLAAIGMMGLYDAMCRYEDRGYKFITYAKFRIRGAILDYLRSVDHGTRSMRKSARELKKARWALTSELNRMPKPSEIADFLKITVDELYDIEADEDRAVHISMSPISEEGDGDVTWTSIEDTLADKQSTIDLMIELEDPIDRLTEIFETLNDQEQAVLSLYYQTELSLKQIGKLLGVTESRACQIYTNTLDKVLEPMSLG